MFNSNSFLNNTHMKALPVRTSFGDDILPKKNDCVPEEETNDCNENKLVLKTLHPPEENINNRLTQISQLEINRRYIEKDYFETHSYITPKKDRVREINKFFKKNINKIRSLKMKNEKKIHELKKKLKKKTSYLKNLNMNEVDNKHINENEFEDESFVESEMYTSNSLDCMSDCLDSFSDYFEPFSDSEESVITLNRSSKNSKESSTNSKVNGDELIRKGINEEDVKNYEYFEHENVRKGELGEHITEEERRELLDVAQNLPNYSQAVKEQNEKVKNVYKHYCKEMKIKPFPITARKAVTFIHHLAKSKRYCISSLDKVVRYSLVRLNLIHTGHPLSRVVNAAIKCEINNLNKDMNVRQPTDGMEPIHVDDLKKILKNIPDFDPDKAKLSSMFLFSLSTGSRASTVAGVKLCHLKHYYNRHDKYGNYALVIEQAVRKSKKVKYKTVTVSGKPGKKRTMNIIYWLEEYLKKSFNTTIKDLVEYNKSKPYQRQEYLWPMSTDSMTQHLKRRARQAGFCFKKIGMHSLRSGFIGSAMLYNSKGGNTSRAVLERCAAVGEWIPGSDAQLTYLKGCIRQTQVGTDLVKITKTDKKGIKTTLKSKNFHQTSLLPTTNKPYSFLVREKLKELLGFPNIYNESNNNKFTKLYSHSLYEYSKDIYKNQQIETNKRITTINEYIRNTIKNKIKTFESIANELLLIIKKDNEEIKWEDKEDIKAQSYTARRNEQFSALAGREVKKAIWTNKEKEIFNDCINKQMNLREIQERIPFRNEKNIYDHLRSVNKKRIDDGEEPIKLPRINERKRKFENELRKENQTSNNSKTLTGLHPTIHVEEDNNKELNSDYNLKSLQDGGVKKDITSNKEEYKVCNSILVDNVNNNNDNSLKNEEEKIITNSKMYDCNMFINITSQYYNNYMNSYSSNEYSLNNCNQFSNKDIYKLNISSHNIEVEENCDEEDKRNTTNFHNNESLNIASNIFNNSINESLNNTDMNYNNNNFNLNNNNHNYNAKSIITEDNDINITSNNISDISCDYISTLPEKNINEKSGCGGDSSRNNIEDCENKNSFSSFRLQSNNNNYDHIIKNSVDNINSYISIYNNPSNNTEEQCSIKNHNNDNIEVNLNKKNNVDINSNEDSFLYINNTITTDKNGYSIHGCYSTFPIINNNKHDHPPTNFPNIKFRLDSNLFQPIKYSSIFDRPDN